jgi:hypothetical protein
LEKAIPEELLQLAGQSEIFAADAEAAPKHDPKEDPPMGGGRRQIQKAAPHEGSKRVANSATFSGLSGQLVAPRNSESFQQSGMISGARPRGLEPPTNGLEAMSVGRQ